MYSANLLFGKRVLLQTLFFLCFIGLSGATSAFVATTPADNAAETQNSEPPKHSQDEQNWSAFFESSRPLAQDWRQYAARDALKPELQTPGRIVLQSVQAPLEGHTPILLLTLQANNIQVRAVWQVTNALNAFDIDNGKLSLTAAPNETATFVATVYLIDNFQLLNTAYQNLTASAVITVSVEVAAMAEGLSVAQPPRLEVTTGVAGEVYVFAASGGSTPHTYTLLHNPDDDAFYFNHGTLSVNVSATIGEYRFTVAVNDADSMTVTVVATVEVLERLQLLSVPSLTVTTSETREVVYSFAPEDEVGDKIYSLENTVAGFGFEFEGAALVLRDDAEAGLYTLSVLVQDGTQESRVSVTVLVIEDVVLAVGVLSPVWSSFDGAVSTLSASGGRGGELTFGLVGDSQVFTLAAGSSTLSLNAGLRGHQGAAILSVTVSVSDGNDSAEEVIEVLVSGALQVSLADGLVAPVHAQYVGLVGSVQVLGGYAGDVSLTLSGSDKDKFELSGGGSLSLSVNISEEQTLTVTVLASRGEETETQEVVVSVYAPLGLSIPRAVTVTTHKGDVLAIIEGSGGDVSSYSYTLTSPTLAGVSINADNGELLLSLTVAASHTLTVQLSDGAGSLPVSQELSVLVIEPLRDVSEAVLAVTLIEDVGEAAAYTFVVAGGIAPYSYTFVESQSLSVNAGSGVLSYAGDATLGVYVVTVSADDAAAASAPIELLLTVEVSAKLSAALSEGARDGVYSFVNLTGVLSAVELSGVGGIAPYTFTLLANDNFGIDADGKNFRITAAFKDAVTVSVVWVLEDSDGRTPAVTGTVQVEIRDELGFADNKPVVNVTVGVKSDGVIYTAKAQKDENATYSQIGTHSSFTVSVSDSGEGALVSMISALSVAMTATLTIKAVDGAAQATLILEVRAYDELSASLAAGFVGQTYAGETGALGAVEASGGSGDYGYALLSLVPGFEVSQGTLSAEDVAAGIHTLTVVVSDNELGGWIAATVEAAVSVGAALSLLEIEERSALVQGEVGEELVQVQVSGGDGLYTISDNLPSGLAISLLSEGIWAVNRAGDLTVGANVGTVIIDDSYALTEPGTPALTAVLTIVGIANFVSPWDIQDMEIIAGGSVELSVEGGTEAKTYGLSTELGGFSLSPAGVLSVSVGAAAGSYTLTVVVSDDTAGVVQAATATLLVEVLERLQLLSVPSLTVTTSETREVVYSFAPEDEVGNKIYSLENTVAGFGFEFEGAALVLRDDAEAGLYTLSVLAQAGAQESRVSVTVLVIEDVVLSVGALMSPVWSTFDGAVATLTASGGNGDELEFALVGDSEVFTLADGSSTLSLNAGLRGHQGAATLSATVSVSDGNDSAVEVITVLVSAALQVVLADGLTAPVDSQYEGLVGSVVVLGGYAGDVSLTLSGSDAGKFELSGGSLSLSVNASEEQTLTVTVVASRGDETAAQEVVVSVYAPLIVAATLTVAQPQRLEVTAGVAKEVYVFEASGGIMPHTYTLLHNPDDDAFYFTQGTLSVNISATIGEYRFTVAVADAASMAVTVTATVEVAAPLPLVFLAEVPPLAVTAGALVKLYTFAAIGGVGDKRYTIVAGKEGGFALAADSGVLSLLSVAAEGVYILSVEASDRALPPSRITAAATVRVGDKQIFVLGGDDGNYKNDAWSSVGGKNWVSITAAGWAGRSSHQALSHNGRLYVLGGRDKDNSRLSDVWSSADGQNWVWETDGAGWAGRYEHQVLSHNGRLYVLGGQDNTNNLLNDVWSSADGQNWSQETNDAGWEGRSSHQALSHNGRLYVLGGDGGGSLNDVWSSADGKNWVRETDGAGWTGRYEHQALSHNGRLYVLGGAKNNNSFLNDVWSSADGKNWVRETNVAEWPGRNGHQALSHNGRLYVLGGQYNTNDFLNDVWSSADGKNWSLETDGANWSERNNHQAVMFPPQLDLGGVGERLTITAGIAADLHTFTAQYGVGDYSYSLDPAVSSFDVSPGGVLSTDGTAAEGKYILTIWVEDSAGYRAQTAVRVLVPYVNLAEVPRLFGLVGIAKDLHTFTTDGGIPGKQYAIVAGNTAGYFALDADSGVLSLLTTAWEGVYTLSVEVSDSASHKATAAATVEISRQIFVLGGNDGSDRLNDVWSSADGKNWGRETDDAGWMGRSSHQALSHNGQLYVLGGNDGGSKRLNDVWFSADGANWSLEPDDAGWAGRSSHQALSHNGRLYVLGGSEGGSSRLNDVWSSADGKNWVPIITNAKWTGRFGHQALSHNGRLYVLGGRDEGFLPLNDVWSSADGANWSLETDNAEWPGRDRHQALSHNGRLYVLGGRDEEFLPLNDVWSSADGANWSRETDNAKWTGREAHQALSHNGRLYVLGGDDDGSEELNDVWSSADGANWSREPNDANWSGRLYHQAVVFPPDLVLLGVGERLTVSAGIAAANLHTFTAQYGRGDYTYSLSPTVSGFAVSPGGVLSAENDATVGEYTLTVWVEDAAGDQAQTALRVDVVAQSTAQSHTFTGEFWATGDESANIVIARSSTNLAYTYSPLTEDSFVQSCKIFADYSNYVKIT